MNNSASSLADRVRLLRNLTVSSFGVLMKTGYIRIDFQDRSVFTKLNALVYKVRSRYDTFSVLSETVVVGAADEVLNALAHSIISNILLIEELLEESGAQALAKPYEARCKSIIEAALPDKRIFASVLSQETLSKSISIAEELRARTEAIPAYFSLVQLAVRIAKKVEIDDAEGLAKIVREITFPPEYQQAGLSILSYFRVALEDKYPNIPISVSIKQESNRVTLIVTLPDGSKEIVTKALNDYGLVVAGRMSPREFLANDMRALALEQKLELAQMEVRQTRELLRVQEQYSGKRIESLEIEVKNLYSLLGRELTSREKLQDGLLKLASTPTTGQMSEQGLLLLNDLANAIAERNAERAKVVLEDIQTTAPNVFSRLNEFFLEAATSGVIGNYVYDWLKLIWPIVPK